MGGEKKWGKTGKICRERKTAKKVKKETRERERKKACLLGIFRLFAPIVGTILETPLTFILVWGFILTFQANVSISFYRNCFEPFHDRGRGREKNGRERERGR